MMAARDVDELCDGKSFILSHFMENGVNPDRKFDRVAVVGAAGKMGRGISAIVATRMVEDIFIADAGREKILFLHDIHFAALQAARSYIYDHGLKFAEKNIQRLRSHGQHRQDLVENADVVQEFMSQLKNLLCPTTAMKDFKDCDVVFEAAIESEAVKSNIFNELRQICQDKTVFFSNTSSMPIHYLEEACQLQGRMVGFHFYNPPPVQVLLELITTEDTPLELKDYACQMAARLNKTVVEARDIAGFIGNGQFIRESIMAVEMLRDLATSSLPMTSAIYAMDMLSKDWLLRPMGVFQLMDYIGLDVFSMIVTVMAAHTENETLSCPLVQTMLNNKKCGGQNMEGGQKDGFFQYEGLKITGVYDMEKHAYRSIKDGLHDQASAWLGPHPDAGISWKGLSRAKNKGGKLTQYFTTLSGMQGHGAALAQEYLKNSKAIAKKLFEKGVAACEKDVNKVMQLGFHHHYGPLWNIQDKLDET